MAEEHINMQFARTGLKMGMGMMMKEMAQGDKKDMIERKSALASFISKDLLPGKRMKKYTKEQVVQKTQEMGQQLGLDPADSVELLGDIFEAGTQSGADIGKGLDNAIKKLNFYKKSIDLVDSTRTMAERGVDKTAEKTAVPAMQKLQEINDRIVTRSGEESPQKRFRAIVNELDDMYGDADLEKGFFQKSTVKSPTEAANKLARHLKANVEEFRAFTVQSLSDVIREMIVSKKAQSVDEAFGLLRTPSDASREPVTQESNISVGGFNQFTRG